MPNSSLNISLPEQLKTYLEMQVEKGEYGTPSEYVRELIRRDKERNLERLERELLEALHSGEIKVQASELERGSLTAVLRGKLAASEKKSRRSPSVAGRPRHRSA
ncbi:MAG TPA: type II toxin-antitoxin system ParD family antitoxin [Acidobacteriaceae bacterium]|nr:type II toxin-antitoxin system ParD family antitoxin [Acidobacteriaceae bacterium]